jgi:hypothetical protein
MTISLDDLMPIERNRLIQAYARMHYAKLYRASKAAQQQTLHGWQTTVIGLQLSYPNLDVNDPGFQQELKQHAHQWWTVKGVKGKGVDW